MNIKVANDLIDYAVRKHSNKFVGIPTNMTVINFNFRQEGLKLPKIEKSNMVTIK